ncbi:MAG TPA: hypothetical protein VH414_05440 [Lichenihabitans sp.]|nr:hypothetical protein [Lichenihabitans sp.]
MNTPLPDGGFCTLYSGGTTFATTLYFAYVDTYDAAGIPIEEDVYYKDGHQTVQGLVPGQTLASIRNDTFHPTGGGNTFVFTPHFGQDTITSFVVGGPHHDTISLPWAPRRGSAPSSITPRRMRPATPPCTWIPMIRSPSSALASPICGSTRTTSPSMRERRPPRR